MERDEEAGKLAEAQHGVISHGQAVRLRFTKSAIQRRVNAGRWRRLLPGVYAICGAPDRWEQRITAAALWAGPAAAVSHLAAAQWYALDGVKNAPVELTLPRSQYLQHPEVLIHRSVWMGSADVTRCRGVRVTCVHRTLVDLAGLNDPEMLELALECALRRGQARLPELVRSLSRLESNRSGASVLWQMIKDRQADQVQTDSALEVRVFRLLRQAGLKPRRQYILSANGQHLARVDLAFPDAQLALQCDGFEYHSSHRSWHRDRDVVSQLAAIHWRVMQLSWRDVEQRPEELVRRVLAAIGV